MTCASKRVTLKRPRLRHRLAKLHLLYRPRGSLSGVHGQLFSQNELNLFKNTQMLARKADNPRAMDGGRHSLTKKRKSTAWAGSPGPLANCGTAALKPAEQTRKTAGIRASN